MKQYVDNQAAHNYITFLQAENHKYASFSSYNKTICVAIVTVIFIVQFTIFASSKDNNIITQTGLEERKKNLTQKEEDYARVQDSLAFLSGYLENEDFPCEEFNISLFGMENPYVNFHPEDFAKELLLYSNNSNQNDFPCDAFNDALLFHRRELQRVHEEIISEEKLQERLAFSLKDEKRAKVRFTQMMMIPTLASIIVSLLIDYVFTTKQLQYRLEMQKFVNLLHENIASHKHLYGVLSTERPGFWKTLVNYHTVLGASILLYVLLLFVAIAMYAFGPIIMKYGTWFMS